MPTEDSGGTAAARSILRTLELFMTNGIQGQFLHGFRPLRSCTLRGCECAFELRYLDWTAQLSATGAARPPGWWHRRRPAHPRRMRSVGAPEQRTPLDHHSLDHRRG